LYLLVRSRAPALRSRGIEEESENAGKGTVVETKERQEEEMKMGIEKSSPGSKCGHQG
jgi:hypothetical protein